MGRAYEVRAKSMAQTAAKKSKLYSIYAKEIIKAGKSNPDPNSNDILRRIIEKAKKEQVPIDVINRNLDKLKKGTNENYDIYDYEVFAQGGSNLIIRCLTDNVNRTISFIKTALNKCDAKMADQGSVSYMYDYLGVLGIKGYNEEEIMNALINNSVDITDIELEEDLVVLYTEVVELNNVKTALEKEFSKIEFEIDEIGYYAKNSVVLEPESKEKFIKLLNMLEEIDDVSNIYHNVEL